MQPGIDKLILTTRSFSISKAAEAGLTVKPKHYILGKPVEDDPVLFKDNSGTTVKGDGAYLHDKLYTLDINQHGLRVIINPSKPYHPYQLVSDTMVFADRIETVERQLKTRGIKLNLMDAKISRVDIARNITTKEPVRMYAGVFNFLDMPRSKRQATYPDGYSTGNNSRGMICYNKLQECRDNGHDVKGDDMLRAELQNKKTDAVKRFLKLNCYADLLSAGVEEMGEIYKATVKNEIFKVKPLYEQPSICYDDTVEIMLYYKKKHPHSWERKYRAIFSINDLIRLHGNIENYLRLVKEIAGNRQQVKRVREDIMKQMQLREQLLKDSPSTKRYNEILNKLVA